MEPSATAVGPTKIFHHKFTQQRYSARQRKKQGAGYIYIYILPSMNTIEQVRVYKSLFVVICDVLDVLLRLCELDEVCYPNSH